MFVTEKYFAITRIFKYAYRGRSFEYVKNANICPVAHMCRLFRCRIGPCLSPGKGESPWQLPIDEIARYRQGSPGDPQGSERDGIRQTGIDSGRRSLWRQG